jgi:hypothetical protein
MDDYGGVYREDTFAKFIYSFRGSDILKWGIVRVHGG